MQTSSTCCSLSVAGRLRGVRCDHESNPGLLPRIHLENSWNYRQPVEDVMFGKLRVTFITLGILLLPSLPLSGQQSYVTRFDAFAGYGFLNSPDVNLFENGFAAQFGVRPLTWLTVGLDYTVAAGNLTLKPAQLLPALQTQ